MPDSAERERLRENLAQVDKHKNTRIAAALKDPRGFGGLENLPWELRNEIIAIMASSMVVSRRLGSMEVRSPVNGRITEVLVRPGQGIEAGEDLLVLEALGLGGIALTAETAGTVEQLCLNAPGLANGGDLLILINPVAA